MKKIWIAIIAPPAVVLFMWGFGELVKYLWNALLPPLFGWHTVTFWQAVGLLVLSRIMVGGLGSNNSKGHDRGWPGPGRWKKMTPEQREQCRAKMRARFGDYDEPPTQAKEPA